MLVSSQIIPEIYIIFQAENINVEQRKKIQDLGDRLQSAQVGTRNEIIGVSHLLILCFIETSEKHCVPCDVLK